MNPEQWLSLKWNGGSTMSDRWLNQSKIIHYLANISYELSKVAGISLKQADDSSKTEWFIHHVRKDQPSDSRSCITGCIPDHWT